MTESDVRTVTKRELVNRIAEDIDQTKVVVRDVLQRFLDAIVDELASGNRLEFREFGVFEVRERAARTAQNPRTLEKVPVPAKKVVKFKVGRTMRERVCEEIDRENVSAATEGARSVASNRAATGGAGAKRSEVQGAAAKAAGARSSSAVGPGSTDADDGRRDPGPGANGTSSQRPQPPTPPPRKPGSPF